MSWWPLCFNSSPCFSDSKIFFNCFRIGSGHKIWGKKEAKSIIKNFLNFLWLTTSKQEVEENDKFLDSSGEDSGLEHFSDSDRERFEESQMFLEQNDYECIFKYLMISPPLLPLKKANFEIDKEYSETINRISSYCFANPKKAIEILTEQTVFCFITTEAEK